MARQTTPDDQQFAGNMAQQMREKLDDLSAANGSGKQPKVEVPPRHAGDRRQRLPVEVIFSNGGCPRGAQVRQRCGRWLNPLSSMKTIVRLSFLAFFLPPANVSAPMFGFSPHPARALAR